MSRRKDDFSNNAAIRLRLVRLIGGGKTLRSILTIPGMPTVNTVRQYCESNPEYGRRLEAARTRGGLGSLWEPRRVSDKPPKRRMQTEVLRTKLMQDYLYIAASNAVKLPPGDDRDYVISDIVEAVLSGEMELEEIGGRAGDFITAHRARFASRKFASLDEKIFEDGDTTRGDRITTDEYRYAD